jgi:hypothetical protein
MVHALPTSSLSIPFCRLQYTMDIIIHTRITLKKAYPAEPIPQEQLLSMQLAMGAEDCIGTAFARDVRITLYKCKDLTGKENSALQRHKLRQLLRMYAEWLRTRETVGDSVTTVSLRKPSVYWSQTEEEIFDIDEVATMRLRSFKTADKDVERMEYRPVFLPNIWFD